MSGKQVVSAEAGLKTPLLSQAIIHNGTVYVSGNIGMDYSSSKIIEGSVADRTVRPTNIDLPQTDEADTLIKETSNPKSRGSASRGR